MFFIGTAFFDIEITVLTLCQKSVPMAFREFDSDTNIFLLYGSASSIIEYRDQYNFNGLTQQSTYCIGGILQWTLKKFLHSATAMKCQA